MAFYSKNSAARQLSENAVVGQFEFDLKGHG
jgi:hypothetical protein